MLRRVYLRRRFSLGLLLETALHLLLARLALRLLPFRWLVWWFQRPVRQPELQGAARHQACAEVRGAIYATNKWLALNAVCFPRAIAAQTMLRRRGISTVLYYGAATLPATASSSNRGKLYAHVWLQDGDRGVVEHDHVASYHVLARYPSTP